MEDIETSEDGKMTTKRKEIGLKIFYTFIAIYGFLAFLNPINFPITRILLGGHPITQYDQIFGLILMVIGLYLLQER